MIKTKNVTKTLIHKCFTKNLIKTIALVKSFPNVGTSRDFVFLWQEKICLIFDTSIFETKAS